MEILVMRHGTTVWNEKKIVQGRTNNRLSSAGKEIASERAKEFKNEKIDLIFASPLMRTMQTANIMNQFHNVKIIKDERIIEIDQGVFTGRKKESLSPEEIELKRTQAESTKMEKFESVFKRCAEFVEFLKREYGDKKVLVVTHNIVASFIELAIKNGYHYREEYINKSCIFKNAELKIFQI